MIGAKGPRMLRLAARYADVWSWFAEERSDLSEFGPRLAPLEAACLDVGRDPATIGRSAGIIVEPTSISGAADVLGVPIRGSAAEIAAGLRAFQAAGFDHLEVVPWPPTVEALDAMGPVLELVSQQVS
jgi:alkanesulfonate monooxygenase SsuD/methylene tetrahydromethanopterin reductase-like flavin-dependent oxidoreductase (luciferase family)